MSGLGVRAVFPLNDNCHGFSTSGLSPEAGVKPSFRDDDESWGSYVLRIPSQIKPR